MAEDNEKKMIPAAKPGKNQFKCFHCRKIAASKDGDWHQWNNMEVHLCRTCEKSTVASPERRTGK